MMAVPCGRERVASCGLRVASCGLRVAGWPGKWADACQSLLGHFLEQAVHGFPIKVQRGGARHGRQVQVGLPEWADLQFVTAGIGKVHDVG